MNAASPPAAREGKPRPVLIWLALIAVSLLWGTMGIATQAALRDGLAPYSLTALRMAMASAILVVYLIATKTRVHISHHSLADGLVMALGQVVLPSVLFAAALQRLPAGAVCLFFALVPAATASWMRVLLRAGTMGAKGGAGLVLALIGTVVVSLNCTALTRNPSDLGLGIGLTLGAVLVASLYGIYAKRHAGHPLFEVMAPQILIGTFVLLAPGLVSGAMDLRGMSLRTWAMVAYLAVGVTVAPTVVLWWLFKRTTAMKVALVN
jgi:drug/metabolite transporter (DMT)-like permease